MVFFLARLDDDAQRAFGAWARERLENGDPTAAAALTPALNGLEHVVAGGAIEGVWGEGSSRRLLGWTTGEHWMLAAAAADAD